MSDMEIVLHRVTPLGYEETGEMTPAADGEYVRFDEVMEALQKFVAYISEQQAIASNNAYQEGFNTGWNEGQTAGYEAAKVTGVYAG